MTGRSVHQPTPTRAEFLARLKRAMDQHAVERQEANPGRALRSVRMALTEQAPATVDPRDELRERIAEALKAGDSLHYGGGVQTNYDGEPLQYHHLADAVMPIIDELQAARDAQIAELQANSQLLPASPNLGVGVVVTPEMLGDYQPRIEDVRAAQPLGEICGVCGVAHLDDDASETKTCTKCRLDKELGAFRVKKLTRTRSEYRLTVCRMCEIADNRAARAAHSAPIETKRCGTCQRVKPASAFHGKKSSGPRGNGETYLVGDCRACVNAKRADASPPPPPLPTAEEMQDWYYRGCPI